MRGERRIEGDDRDDVLVARQVGQLRGAEGAELGRRVNRQRRHGELPRLDADDLHGVGRGDWLKRRDVAETGETLLAAVTQRRTVDRDIVEPYLF